MPHNHDMIAQPLSSTPLSSFPPLAFPSFARPGRPLPMGICSVIKLVGFGPQKIESCRFYVSLRGALLIGQKGLIEKPNTRFKNRLLQQLSFFLNFLLLLSQVA